MHVLTHLCVFNISLVSSEKENAQPFVVLPKEFPVYLWQPFLRHGYFCFQEAADQRRFSALLSDCIRHLNRGKAARSPRCAAFPQVACLLEWPGKSRRWRCPREGEGNQVNQGSIHKERGRRAGCSARSGSLRHRMRSGYLVARVHLHAECHIHAYNFAYKSCSSSCLIFFFF